MPPQCSPTEMDFGRAGGRRVVADFDGGMVSSDAGALLLGEADEAIGLTDRFAACFVDRRNPLMTVHALTALVAQRVFGLALGYEDLNDHDELRGDPVLGVLLGKLERAAEAPGLLAGKSTLNRLEHAPGTGKAPRYHKIGHDAAAIEKLLVDLFLDAHHKAPRQIVLDLDATGPRAWTRGPAARRSGRPVLPRLLRLLLLSAALHVLRPAFAVRQAQALQHRRQRRGGRGDRSPGGSDPRALAEGEGRAARRFRLRARGLDGLVRSQHGQWGHRGLCSKTHSKGLSFGLPIGDRAERRGP
jgi:Transposase DDE domain group 1